MEKQIQDILNAGIGLFKAGEANFKQAFETVEKTFEDLKTRGAADNSEAAVKIREVLDNTIKSIKGVSDQAGSNFNLIVEEAQKNYAQVLEQIKTFVGEERIRDLNSKIEELTEYIKKQQGGGDSTPAAPAAAPKPAAKKKAAKKASTTA